MTGPQDVVSCFEMKGRRIAMVRSDEEIRKDIVDRHIALGIMRLLERKRNANLKQVDVKVEDGFVSLSGEVTVLGARRSLRGRHL
jgi:osmotically-inducible protein OsmY